MVSSSWVAYALMLTPEGLLFLVYGLIQMLQFDSCGVCLRDSDGKGSLPMTASLAGLNTYLSNVCNGCASDSLSPV